jgi:protein-tyrosine-phosphatase
LAAHYFGVHIGEHRSRILSEDMVRRADVILIFEPDQEQAVREWFPYGANKVHYLGALRRGGGIHIRDPWGCGENEFLRVYQEIQQTIERAFGASPAVYADAGLNTRSASACFKSSMP